MNWTTTDNFRFLKVAVEVLLCRYKGRITMLTNRNVLERTLRRIVPTFSGILKKYVKFEYIKIGMVYPTQSGDCGLLSQSNRYSMKDIMIKRDDTKNGMRYLEVIIIIGKMAHCKDVCNMYRSMELPC